MVQWCTAVGAEVPESGRQRHLPAPGGLGLAIRPSPSLGVRGVCIGALGDLSSLVGDARPRRMAFAQKRYILSHLRVHQPMWHLFTPVLRAAAGTGPLNYQLSDSG